MKTLLAALLSLAACHPALAGGPRTRESFDSGWRFSRFGLQADGTRLPEPDADNCPAATGFDDSAWRVLDLPHDWGVEGPFRLELAGETGKLPWRGIGWYRKHITIPQADRGRRVFLDFDGAMANAKVYCNGHEAGGWPYGYTSFRVDLTPFLNFGGDNTVAVRLDTEKWDSRWYPGAGIYRHVWLVKTDPLHIAQWGVSVTTPEILVEKGVARIEVTVANQTRDAAPVTVETVVFPLLDSGLVPNRPPTSDRSETTVPAGGEATIAQTVTVPSPRLWTLEHPGRYVARTTVRAGSRVTDVVDTPFGFRTIRFTARDGFQINGTRVPIRGTCNHHDLGALGAALNDRALERQLQILKDMGCNALRTSHNPPAPELLDLADRMGFLVWDEAFDCWKRGKKPNDYGKLYDDWHGKDLTALVKRDRNHPSVVVWSIGNEVMEQTNVPMTKHLADIMRGIDPTRPVSNGYNNAGPGRASGAALGLDLMGINYRFDEDRWMNDPRYANMPTLGSETSSCVSSRGEYFFDKGKSGWQISSYDLEHPGWGCTPDEQFRMNARWPHLLGEFVWTGFDYLGEPTPFGSNDETQLLNFRSDPAKRAELEKEMVALAKKSPPSRSSYFGIIDLAGFPKDRYYLYQSQWRPGLPMAHLLPHWNWPERVGETTPVHLYTSGDEAELFLNGKSLGRKAKEPGKDFRLVWPDVKYQPGELKAIAYKDGKPWAETTVHTTGKAAKLALEPDRATIKADGRDLSFITVRIADAEGRTVPRSHNPVHFAIDGPGEIVAVDNGDPTSFEPFQADKHKAFNGLALVIVRSAPGQSGPFTVKASAEGLEPATTAIAGE